MQRNYLKNNVRVCEQTVIKVSIENFLSFPWIKFRLNAGKLDVHGWCFDIEKGILFELNQKGGVFSFIG